MRAIECTNIIDIGQSEHKLRALKDSYQNDCTVDLMLQTVLTCC